MACEPTPERGELDFVQALLSRQNFSECRGPLLVLILKRFSLFQLELMCSSTMVSDRLWGGYQPGVRDVYQLCAAHWVDIATVAGYNARSSGRADWQSEALGLLRAVCEAASWDVKEISNMFAWQRQFLT